ncbi:thymidylate synthetase [Klebsiella phage CPRSA]|nr:thymidylate synthetase [Klebsiella phage CPRSA]UQJ95728.1 thymidylate synthetase [Klebsiella phage CPRSB]
MKQYLDIIKLVLDNGVESTDRTGVGTIRIFGAQARWDLNRGFPQLPVKNYSSNRASMNCNGSCPVQPTLKNFAG